MNEEIERALDLAAVRQRLDAEGFERQKMSPAALTAFIQSELTKWAPLAKKLVAESRAQ